MPCSGHLVQPWWHLDAADWSYHQHKVLNPTSPQHTCPVSWQLGQKGVTPQLRYTTQKPLLQQHSQVWEEWKKESSWRLATCLPLNARHSSLFGRCAEVQGSPGQGHRARLLGSLLSCGLISWALASEAAEHRPRFSHTNSAIYKVLSVVTRSKTQHFFFFKSHNSKTPPAQGWKKKTMKMTKLLLDKTGGIMGFPPTHTPLQPTPGFIWFLQCTLLLENTNHMAHLQSLQSFPSALLPATSSVAWGSHFILGPQPSTPIIMFKCQWETTPLCMLEHHPPARLKQKLCQGL